MKVRIKGGVDNDDTNDDFDYDDNEGDEVKDDVKVTEVADIDDNTNSDYMMTMKMIVEMMEVADAESPNQRWKLKVGMTMIRMTTKMIMMATNLL